jgi:hypothetical protein
MREATNTEFDMIKKCFAAYTGEEPDENSIDSSFITIIEDYMTGSPGYVGKVAVVVFDGSPEHIMSFTQKHDKTMKDWHKTTKSLTSEWEVCGIHHEMMELAVNAKYRKMMCLIRRIMDDNRVQEIKIESDDYLVRTLLELNEMLGEMQKCFDCNGTGVTPNITGDPSVCSSCYGCGFYPWR